MLRFLSLVFLVSCARYNLAHQCNVNTCKAHKKSVKQAQSKEELRPRFECQSKDSEGRCLWVKI